MTTAVVAALIGVANSQGLFPPLLSDLEFGHPAWGTPTSRWSSTCPYGNIDGVSPGSPQSYTDWQALVGELDALKQRHEVMAGDTWQTIANQYYGGNNAAGLEQVLRYNGLDGSDPVSPVPGTFVNVGGTGLSTVLPECSCPVGYFVASDDLYCRNDDPNSVFLSPRPRRVYITGHDGSTDDARPAGYITSGIFRTGQGVELTYWEVDTANASATATQSGAPVPSAELYVDLGAPSSIRDITVGTLQGSPIPKAIVFGTKNASGHFVDEIIAVDCDDFNQYQTLAGGMYATLDAMCIGSFTTGRYQRQRNGRPTPPVETSQIRITVFSDFCDSNCQNLNIQNVRVTGRRACNGHASSAWAQSDGASATCLCEHNTMGPTCDECLPTFNNAAWAGGTLSDANACSECNCNSHLRTEGGSCHFDTSKGHGVCNDCIDNTMGDFCESCLPSFKRNQPSNITSSDTCISCNCDAAGGADGIHTECVQEQDGYTHGQCQCKSNVQGLLCDECRIGFHSLTANNPQGCVECTCSAAGSVIREGETVPDACIATDGQCECKANVTGRDCDACRQGHHMLSQMNPDGCSECKFGEILPGGAQLYMFSHPDTNACLDCHPECLECTATGAGSCIACRNFHNTVDDTCVEVCPMGTYENFTSMTCHGCHENCRTGSQCLANDRATCSCLGPSADECTECVARIVEYSPFVPLEPPLTVGGSRCLAVGQECPISHFADSSATCQACNSNCDLTQGCDGPTDGNCAACSLFENNGVCVSSCPIGTWIDPVSGVEGVSQCSRCSDQCRTGLGCAAPEYPIAAMERLSSEQRILLTASTCTNAGPAGCAAYFYDSPDQMFSHANITVPSRCIADCPARTSFTNYDTMTCIECDSECAIGCTAAGADSCARSPTTGIVMCRNFLVQASSTSSDTCVASCPPADVASPGGWRVDGTTCSQCHSQCDRSASFEGDSCYGPRASQCIRCQGLEQEHADGSTVCVPVCDPGFGPSSWGQVIPEPEDDTFRCIALEDELGAAACAEAIAIEAIANRSVSEACNRPAPTEAGSGGDGSGADGGPADPSAVHFAQDCQRTCCTGQTGAPTQPTTTEPTTTTALVAGGRLPSPLRCIECPFRLAGTELCIESCDLGNLDVGWLFPIAGTTTCGQCSSQCRTGCTGPSQRECTGANPCANSFRVENGQSVCVDSCMTTAEYSIVADAGAGLQCASCPAQCGATNPNQCCASNGFSGETAHCGFRSNGDCVQCHAVCESCSGPGVDGCEYCAAVRGSDGLCAAECMEGQFAGAHPLNEHPGDDVCQACSSTCDAAAGCTGPHPSQCNVCAVARNSDLACVAECVESMVMVPAYNPNTTRFVDSVSPLTRSECVPCEGALHFEDPEGNCVPCSSACFSGCNGPTSSDCEAGVDSPQVCTRFALQDGLAIDCVDECPLGTAPDFSPDGNRCVTCSDQCLAGTACTGPAPEDCSVCSAYRLFNAEGPCTSNCPSEGPFFNPTGEDSTSLHRICQRCDTACAVCSGARELDCPRDGCTVGYVYDANLGCQSNCPVGRYAQAGGDGSNPHIFCADCHHSCNAATGCRGPDADECGSCQDNSFQTTDGRTICFATCPGGTFSMFGRCTRCSSACSSIATCTDTSDGTCMNPEWIPDSPGPTRSVILNLNVGAASSLFGSSLSAVSGEILGAFNGCNFITTDFQIREADTTSEGATVSLIVPVRTESTAQQLYDRLGAVVSEQNTVVECLDNAFRRSGTVTSLVRSGPVLIQGYVTPCGDGYVLEDGICKVGCDGGFADADGICQSCDSRCATCDGPDVSDCLTCAVAQGSNGACVESCGHDFFSTGGLPATCEACHAQCDGCTGTGSGNCLACKNFEFEGRCVEQCNGHIDGNACVPQCPSGVNAKYPDANNDCQPCNPLCNTCSGPSVDECTTCLGVRGIDGICGISCGPNTWSSEGSCYSCHSQCQGSCSGPLASQCDLTADSNGVARRCKGAVDGDVCVEKCAAGSFYQIAGLGPVVDQRGGYVCQSCPAGFRCADGITANPCETDTFSCRTGALQCYTCPRGSDGRNLCQFNFDVSVYDHAVCEAGSNLDLATCTCDNGLIIEPIPVGTGNGEDDTTAGGSTILLAVAIGGVALLLFVGAIVYLMKDNSGADALSNETMMSIASMQYGNSTPMRGMNNQMSGVSLANSGYGGGYNAGLPGTPETSI